MSLAWEHRKKIMADRQQENERESLRAADASHPPAASGSSHDLLLTAIRTECDRISGLPRGEARTGRKRAVLKTYLPEIDRYLNGGTVSRNTALTQVMIWCFDVGDMENAMRLARAAIEQKQPLPERFNRNIKTGVCDFVYDWCLARKAEGKSLEPYFQEIYTQLFPAEGHGWQICDDVRLKYVKMAIGETTDPRHGLLLCELAESIDPAGAKVKTRKEKFRKEIAELDEKAKYQKC